MSDMQGQAVKQTQTDSAVPRRAWKRLVQLASVWTSPCLLTFIGETLLTCPALNGRHLLLALRLSLPRRRVEPCPVAACCSIVPRPRRPSDGVPRRLEKSCPLGEVSSQSWQTFLPFSCQRSNYRGQTYQLGPRSPLFLVRWENAGGACRDWLFLLGLPPVKRVIAKELKATQSWFLKVGGGRGGAKTPLGGKGEVQCHEKLWLIECEHRTVGQNGEGMNLHRLRRLCSFFEDSTGKGFKKKYQINNTKQTSNEIFFFSTSAGWKWNGSRCQIEFDSEYYVW